MPLALFVLAGLQAETLRIRPVIGKRTSYRMTLSIEVTGADLDENGTTQVKADMSFLLGERVLRVEGETIHLRRYLKIEEARVDNEVARPMLDAFQKFAGESMLKIDRRNRSVGSNATVLPVATFDVTFPEVPAVLGSSWEGPFGTESSTSILYTLRGVASVAGRRVALIDAASTDPKATFRVMPDSIFAIDLSDGRWLRTRAYFESTQDETDIDVHYEIARDGAPEWSTILAAFPPAAPTTPGR